MATKDQQVQGRDKNAVVAAFREAAKSRHMEPVELPALGITVQLAEMTGAQYDAYTKQGKSGGMTPSQCIADTLFDEEGRKVPITAGEVAGLPGKSYQVLMQAWAEVNGFSDASKDDMVGNSSAVPSGGSSSD